MFPRPKVNLDNLGTHSLKTGLLTMAARSSSVKFSLGERRTLGHHIKPGDRSVLTHRETYTSLHGKVLACFLEIQTALQGSWKQQGLIEQGFFMKGMSQICPTKKMLWKFRQNSVKSRPGTAP